MTLDECDRLFELVRAAASAAEACYTLLPIFDAYQTIALELPLRSQFWRARRDAPSEPWSSVSQMGYPPAERASRGRLNDERSPCFYAATRLNTALAEVGVKEGDYVQIAGFRSKLETPLRIAMVGELYHVYKTGYLRLTGNDPAGRALSRFINEHSPAEGERLLYIDAFLSSLLADERAADIDYRLSRAVASMINRDTNIDGFLFPSVRDAHGMNLALKASAFDLKVQPVCCVHARVKKVHSFGFVEYEVLREAQDITPAGDLIWRDPESPSRRRYFNLTKEEYNSAQQGSQR